MPDEVIICSDSTDTTSISKERMFASKYEATYISNNCAHNCSGVRNMAVMTYIQNNIYEYEIFSHTYIAFLDDDDFWNPHYIEKCYNGIYKDSDFVVSGIVYHDADHVLNLSIPQHLSVEDFLKGNPHIQGSNIFIKLTTLLKSGLFDENLSSSVDRDIFVRIMQLNPHFSIVREHLVYVDANNKRERVTNSIELKQKDTVNFYRKYVNIMSDEVRTAFFTRNKELFNLDIEKCMEYRSHEITTELDSFFLQNPSVDYRIIVGIIISNQELGLRLLKELGELELPRLKIVIIKNNKGDIAELKGFLQKVNCDYHIYECNKTIREICTARNILFSVLYSESKCGDIFWVLDDDMQLSYLSDTGAKYKTNIVNVINRYKNKYDAIVGDYTLDPPLPVLSTLRTKLLDYVYHNKMGFNDKIEIANMADYYYDLSERTGEHLETPFAYKKEITLNEIFCGKATSRPLYFVNHNDTPAFNCGGNVLIFNRNILKVKHLSLTIADNTGRRSDFFWVLESIRQGYTISNVAFATMHNRNIEEFNYEKEINKLLRDIIGSSCTKAIIKLGVSHNYEELKTAFTVILLSRVTKFIVSYYRIIGLLIILEDSSYTTYFSETNLNKFIDIVNSLIEKNDLCKEWKLLVNKINRYE